ncbi:hypothetical protein EDC04DRAFT_2606530 [Pisolithus marmoratus]|nr:hypothetical protein EDC04DRAFT_2606530 [Pisolithus marmoratus]
MTSSCGLLWAALPLSVVPQELVPVKVKLHSFTLLSTFNSACMYDYLLVAWALSSVRVLRDRVEDLMLKLGQAGSANESLHMNPAKLLGQVAGFKWSLEACLPYVLAYDTLPTCTSSQGPAWDPLWSPLGMAQGILSTLFHLNPSPRWQHPMKQTKKHAQDPGKMSGNEMVLWEPYPQLTRDLLTWILDHPADCAVLFNKKIDQSVLGKPHSMQKKNINVVIGDSLFHHNHHYADLLKNKYQQQASRFKSTGEGIDPNDPNHWNLHEKVLADFPFWDECNWLWHDNPAYNARVFNAIPGANWTGDFLSIIKHGATMVTPTYGGPQVQIQDNIPAKDPDYITPFADADQALGSEVLMQELQQDEDEEGANEGDLGMLGPQAQLGPHPNAMSLNDQPQTFDDDITPEHNISQPSKEPRNLMKYQTPGLTPSSNNCSAFHISTKGKNALAQIKANLDELLSDLNKSSLEQQFSIATFKYEARVMKVQAYMCNKEITHLETENERDHHEVESIHHWIVEQKELDILMLKEECENLCLKVELAKLQGGDASAPASE